MLNKGIPTQVWKHPTASHHNSYESQHGSIIWEFGVKFENGQTGVFGGQDAEYPKFKVGELAHYEFTESSQPGKWPDKIKFVSERDAGTGEGFGPPPEQAAQDQGFGPPPETAAPAPGPAPAAPSTPTPFENPLKTRNINRQTCVHAAARYMAQRTSTTDGKDWQDIAEDMFKWINEPAEGELPF